VKWNLRLAVAAGLGFAALSSRSTRSRSTPASRSPNEFFRTITVSRRFHFFHVLIGIGVITACFVKARASRSNGRYVMWLESAGCYWHMVDLLWIVLFPMLYLLRAA